MPINWQDVLTNIGTKLVSDVVVAGAPACVKRTLVSARLARDAESFTMRVKADADVEMAHLRHESAQIPDGA
jgi:hypothetical protein